MNITTARPGSSIVKFIIIFVVLAGLGVGGYFGYAMYLAPMLNPYSKLIPEGLKDYAKGKDADMFFVYKKNQEIETFIKKLPAQAAPGNDLVSAIMVAKGNSQSGALIAEFSSADKAQSTKSLIDTNLQKNQSNPPPPLSTEIHDKVLIINFGAGLSSFNGPLLENPNITNIDKTMLDNQFIAEINNASLPDANSILPGMMGGIPTQGFGNSSASPLSTMLQSAHAQGFISASDNPSAVAVPPEENTQQQDIMSWALAMSFAKNTTVYVKLNNSLLSSKIVLNFMNKNEISGSSLAKTAPYQTDTKALETLYDKTMQQFQASIPDLQRAVGFVKLFMPSFDGKMNFANNTATVDVQLSTDDLTKGLSDSLPGMLNGPAKARDAARKADLNNIITAIETYNSDNQKYPETSGCLESMTGLTQYFYKNTPPKDYNGAQTFGNTTCTSGYFYQYIAGKEYVLWAKMEATPGETNLTPDEFEKNVKDNISFATGGGGKYYIVIKEISGTGDSSTTAAPTTQEATNTSAINFYLIANDPSTDKVNYEFTTNPGSNGNSSFDVMNTGTNSGSVQLFAVDATKDAKDSVKYAKQSDTPTLVGKWLTLKENTAFLQGDEKKTIPFTLNVPADAPPGDYFGGIVGQTKSQTMTTSLTLRVIVHVGGAGATPAATPKKVKRTAQ